MSRSGYSDGIDSWALIRWRGQVESAIRGKRGQAFLKEILAALDAMPEKRLIDRHLIIDGHGGEFARDASNPIVGADELIDERGHPIPLGATCAMGAVGKARGLDMSKVDAHDPPSVAGLFGIAEPLAKEIAYVNDEGSFHLESPEARYKRVRKWVESQIWEWREVDE